MLEQVRCNHELVYDCVINSSACMKCACGKIIKEMKIPLTPKHLDDMIKMSDKEFEELSGLKINPEEVYTEQVFDKVKELTWLVGVASFTLGFLTYLWLFV